MEMGAVPKLNFLVHSVRLAFLRTGNYALLFFNGSVAPVFFDGEKFFFCSLRSGVTVDLSLSDCRLLDGDVTTLDLGWLLRFFCFRSSSLLSDSARRRGVSMCSKSLGGFDLSPVESTDKSDTSSS